MTRKRQGFYNLPRGTQILTLSASGFHPSAVSSQNNTQGILTNVSRTHTFLYKKISFYNLTAYVLVT